MKQQSGRFGMYTIAAIVGAESASPTIIMFMRMAGNLCARRSESRAPVPIPMNEPM